MADIQTSSSTGKTKAPAKKTTTKANGKKAAATGGRTTVTKPRKPSSPKPKVKAEPPSVQTVTPEERWRMVAEAAYLRAEQRGFSGGNPTDDWLAAEAEVDKYLSEK